MTRAAPTEKTSTPPSGEVRWKASASVAHGNAFPHLPRWVFVHARTWFAARALGMAALGCGMDEIHVVLA